jgi:hypothetical protein
MLILLIIISVSVSVVIVRDAHSKDSGYTDKFLNL